jgi:hypothetical protein
LIGRHLSNQSKSILINGTITGYEPAKVSMFYMKIRLKSNGSSNKFECILSENIFSMQGIFQKSKIIILKVVVYLVLILMILMHSGNQSQSDLNNPDRQVVVGDTYGYNYNYFANTLEISNFKFTYNKVDFYKIFQSNYQREGLYKTDLRNQFFWKSEK